MLEHNSARLQIDLAGVRAQVLQFLDDQVSPPKEEIKALVDKAIAEFDLEAAIKREIDEAIERRISQAVARTTYSEMLGWNSPFVQEIDRMVKAAFKEKLAPIIEGDNSDG